MKVCERTSRRRKYAARYRTRNLLNRHARLPAQDGPGPPEAHRLAVGLVQGSAPNCNARSEPGAVLLRLNLSARTIACSRRQRWPRITRRQ